MQQKRIQKYIITLCLYIFQILYSITIPPSSSLNVIYRHILSPPARTTYHMIFEQFVCNILLSISIFLQNISCYGLLDIEVISPVPTGQWLELPYYAGCRYVAYKSSQTNQVNFTNYEISGCYHNNIQDAVCLSVSCKTSVFDPPYQWLSCDGYQGDFIIFKFDHIQNYFFVRTMSVIC